MAAGGFVNLRRVDAPPDEVPPPGAGALPLLMLLFVGSSALTGGFLPRDLAIPQLLRSNVWAIVPLGMRDSLTVFLHRGLSPISSRPCQPHTIVLEWMPGSSLCSRSDIIGPAPLSTVVSRDL